MKALELVEGTTYINRYGDEFTYLGPCKEQVPYMDFSGKALRRPTRNDVLVAHFMEMGVNKGTVRSHKVKGGTWHEVVVQAASLQQPLAQFLAKRARGQAVVKHYQAAAKQIAKRLRERGVDAGKMSWGKGYEKIDIPEEPGIEGDWSELATFDPKSIIVHLSVPELEKLLGEG
jgi:hypothetical protein